tara:strand:- start:308 stop:559 length:252 start_codon:yes stop_codon:yes gene_type:complete
MGYLTNGEWDLITFIFFGFMLYKACTRPFREIIWLALKSPFTSNETTKERIQSTLILIAIILVLAFVIGGWLINLFKIIKIFI